MIACVQTVRQRWKGGGSTGVAGSASACSTGVAGGGSGRHWKAAVEGAGRTGVAGSASACSTGVAGRAGGPGPRALHARPIIMIEISGTLEVQEDIVLLTPDQLWPTVRSQSRRALESGALMPISTSVHVLEEHGLKFAVRRVEKIVHKEKAGPTDEHAPESQRRGDHQSREGAPQSRQHAPQSDTHPGDPFAPPFEPDLFVGEVSETHVALLNKFNVLDEHLLLVTREYEPQTALLQEADFRAMLRALACTAGLAFYNGGPDAGASQAHKHLQVVRLPIADGVPVIPFIRFFEQAAGAAGDGPGRDGGACGDVSTGSGAGTGDGEARGDVSTGAAANASAGSGAGTRDGGSGSEAGSALSAGRAAQNPELPFTHAFARMPYRWQSAPDQAATAVMELCQELWHTLGYSLTGNEQPVPYNFLATTDWLWLVPRSRETYEGIAVNALGFAGALLVRDAAMHRHLEEIGPLQVLAGVSAG